MKTTEVTTQDETCPYDLGGGEFVFAVDPCSINEDGYCYQAPDAVGMEIYTSS